MTLQTLLRKKEAPMLDETRVREALATVYDPEIGLDLLTLAWGAANL